MPTKKNPTPEEEAFIAGGERVYSKYENYGAPVSNLTSKMNSQALANAALSRPGTGCDSFLKTTSMSQDEFEAEFVDVPNANAHDEDDG